LTLTNSIVSANTALSSNNISGDYVYFGADSLVNTANIMLAPLGNYGGPTQTMPALPGSPAIDAGVDTGSLPATDQRGFARVVNGTVDIGAVEGVFNPDFELVSPTALGDGTFQFSFTNLSGASFTVVATTNVALPTTNWLFIGPATEVPPGSGTFQFIDPEATNYSQRFYSVRLP